MGDQRNAWTTCDAQHRGGRSRSTRPGSRRQGLKRCISRWLRGDESKSNLDRRSGRGRIRGDGAVKGCSGIHLGNLGQKDLRMIQPELQGRLEAMIRPALFAGHFGTSFTRCVCGLQYHLGGAQDTAELASLADISADDHVLDVCCLIGGPALQLAEQCGCRVTGIDLMESADAAPFSPQGGRERNTERRAKGRNSVA